MKSLRQLLLSLIVTMGILLVCMYGIQSYHKIKAVNLMRKAFLNGNLKDIPLLLDNNKAPWISVLLTLLDDQNDQVKINALTFIPSAEDRARAAGKLIDLLKDNNWRVRFFTVKALGSIKSRESSAALTEAFAKEDMWQVQREISIAISKIGEKDSIPNFLEYYESGDDTTKIFSAIVLYRLTREDKYFSFIQKTIYSENIENAHLMIWTLGELKERSTLPLLHNAINKTNDPKLVRTIEVAIEKMQ